MRCVELNKRTLASENFQDFPSNLILFLYLFPASYSFQFIFIFSFMSLFFNLVLSILTSLPMILQHVFFAYCLQRPEAVSDFPGRGITSACETL